MKELRNIDISEIAARNKELNQEINYDDVRDRIRQVLSKITDKTNKGKKVSQETMGRYLFPHLGAESSVQSTMSRFVNGNKEAKISKGIAPDISALIRLSQLTGISTDWFLYGKEHDKMGSNKKTLQDWARLILIDMKRDFKANIELVNCPEDDLPVPQGEFPYIRIDIPIETYTHYDDDRPLLYQDRFIEWNTPLGDLVAAVDRVMALDTLIEQFPFDSPANRALSNAIQLTIQDLANVLPPFGDSDDDCDDEDMSF